MIVIKPEDFETPEGREKVANFLNGVSAEFIDLIRTPTMNKELIDMGKAYAKPENLNFQ